jgi:TolA-binding protein
MAEQKLHTVDTDPLSQAKNFWNKFQKPITIAVAAVVVVVGGWYAYQNWFVQPKEEQAEDTIFKAQKYFAMDSLNLALNGDGASKGFLYVIKNYDGTKTGNLAKYYAGVCYLRTGDYNKAIDNLKDFSTSAKQVQMMAYGCLGDAYSELKKNDDAIDNYKKAASAFESDEANSSEYLFRAALLEETSGKTQDAIDLYKELKDKFPKSQRAGEADKYIYRLGVQPNDFSVK